VLYVAATRTLNRLQPNKLVSKLVRPNSWTGRAQPSLLGLQVLGEIKRGGVLNAATLSHERACTSAVLTIAWRYRMADPHAAGVVINKAGAIDRAQVEASLRERFGREVIELEPCL
jgi:hypothetical protein